jgi:hypothetical protein
MCSAEVGAATDAQIQVDVKSKSAEGDATSADLHSAPVDTPISSESAEKSPAANITCPADPPLVPDTNNAAPQQPIPLEAAAAGDAEAESAAMEVVVAAAESAAMEVVAEAESSAMEVEAVGNEEDVLANKENQSASPNIASEQLSAVARRASSSSSGKLLTVVNEKNRARPGSSSNSKAAGASTTTAMNSRGAMLLNLSRYRSNSTGNEGKIILGIPSEV